MVAEIWFTLTEAGPWNWMTAEIVDNRVAGANACAFTRIFVMRIVRDQLVEEDPAVRRGTRSDSARSGGR